LRGLVFKSHGSADAFGYECAIKRAFDAANHDVLARISSTIAELMPQPELASGSESTIVVSELTQQKTA
jgi:glycerol-3-phosphate acyltransferase PlsX